MLKDKAEKERQINSFPPPYRLDATPYLNVDFDSDIKDACFAANKSPGAGVKISKAIFLGDVAVGKTCLVNRFCHHVFDSNYKATIGVDFEVECFDILDVPFNLQIWDTAGQERFKCIASSYYRGAHVVVVVFDLTSLMTLMHCHKWLEEALSANSGTPKMFLVGTKKDLLSEAAYAEVESQAVRVARTLGVEYWAVSSRTGDGVAPFFLRLAALAFDATVENEANNSTISETEKIGSSDLVCLSNKQSALVTRRKCGGCE
ncbi:ras-related protein Rab-36-like [Ischnura elegans]|uniref:ras-related protein Rab-36-like n=1 Tax=Ischnura elegans TaxID=197161 RepID=UPI001ED8A3C0|nr:ras-related protein Rab-36-like [Ischnura elegans]XP_046391043.1 ras-related protein Rab-36-like [Ischnura elegans]XP_046391044.1 ras-related protein Rab-36-like [Ischnura elegans]